MGVMLSLDPFLLRMDGEEVSNNKKSESRHDRWRERGLETSERGERETRDRFAATGYGVGGKGRRRRDDGWVTERDLHA
jgi:hypothetical protein